MLISNTTKVIHVGGTDYDIGRQHTESCRDVVNEGMLEFYSSFWRRIYDSVPKGVLSSAGYKVGRLLVDPWLVSRLARQIPPFARECLRGVADVSGRSYRELETSLILPDMMPILQALLVKLRPDDFLATSGLPRFGCSSFIASGRNFLHGRNLDFPGVGYWDRFPVIQVTTPKGGLRYIGFTTAGAPFGGITGINEAQISVSLHQHYCREFSLKGTLPFVIGEQILRRARTLEEALDVIREAKVASSWAFLVCDGKTRQAFLCEANPKTIGVVRLSTERPVLTHSNCFQSPECLPSEYSTSARMNWDNRARKDRLYANVVAKNGELTPEEGASFLSEHWDPFWEEEKIANRIVSQIYNIQSLVLDPVSMKAYFAEGNSPVHLRGYREYDLGELFAGREGKRELCLPGYTFRSYEKRAAKEHYVRAFQACFAGENERSLNEALLSLEKDFCPEIAQAAAVLSMQLGDTVGARELLAKGKAWIEKKRAKKFPPEYYETTLFLGRAEFLLGNTAKAHALYDEVATHPEIEDAHIRRIAQAKRPYKREALSRILIPFAAYVPFN